MSRTTSTEPKNFKRSPNFSIHLVASSFEDSSSVDMLKPSTTGPFASINRSVSLLLRQRSAELPPTPRGSKPITSYALNIFLLTMYSAA